MKNRNPKQNLDNSDLDNKLYEYYNKYFKRSQSISSIAKNKLMKRIYKYSKFNSIIKRTLKTITAAAVIGASIMLFYQYSEQAKIEENINIIE